jgi:HAD superfamily hydrolase (TIGR01549 family)
VFLDYDRLAEGVGGTLGLPLSGPALAQHVPAATRAMEQSGGTDRDRATAFLESLFLLAGVPRERLSEVQTCLAHMHRQQHLWSSIPARLGESLARLRASGLRLGVVSNSDGRVDQALRAAGLRHYFDVVIDSSLVGVEKPDPRIFQAALDALAVTPEETLYVGDLYEVDVLGAQAAGLQAVLLGHPEERRDCRQARSIEELVDQLLSKDTS